MATHDNTIGIVEDDDGVRTSMAALLKVSDFQTQCFASPLEFLDSDLKSAIDCLIVDVRLPVISGIELLKRLAADGVHIPAIVISGHFDAEINAQVAHMTDVQFLAKPYDPNELLALIRRAVSDGQMDDQ